MNGDDGNDGELSDQVSKRFDQSQNQSQSEKRKKKEERRRVNEWPQGHSHHHTVVTWSLSSFTTLGKFLRYHNVSYP